MSRPSVDEREVRMDKISRIKAFSYFVSLCQKHYKEDHPYMRVSFVEFSKHCGERWRDLSEKQKYKFHLLAEDKRKSDIATIVLSDDDDDDGAGPLTSSSSSSVKSKSTVRKGKKTSGGKDKKGKKCWGDEPKKPRQAYAYFMKDQHANAQLIQGKSLDVTLINREIGALWRRTSPEAKARYAAMAKYDKVRYEKELREFEKRQKSKNGHMGNGKKNASVR